MPEEAYWETLFDVPVILDRLDLAGCGDVAELGCGYGTFTVPIAQVSGGTVWTFDVDPAMLARTRERAAGLPIVCEHRDVMAEGFGVHVDCVLLFNILHCEHPIELLRHATKALNDGGPSLDIRPRPEQLIQWAGEVDLEPIGGVIDLPPWHYGLRFRLLS